MRNAKDFVVGRLKDAIAEAAKTRNKFAKDFAESNLKALYDLRWMSGVAQELIEAAWFEETLMMIENQPALDDAGVIKQLKTMIAVVEDKLRYWHPENSTSPYSNAIHNEEYEAMRHVIERLQSWQR